jgi:hypothetical protein
MEMKTILLIAPLIAGCIPETLGIADTADPPENDTFVNKWWEVVEGPPLKEFKNSCFLLHDNSFFNGGTIIRFEDQSPWPHFESLYRWNYTDDRNIYIVEEEYVAEATPRADGCWDIEYSIFNGVACECSYDTQAVAKFED